MKKEMFSFIEHAEDGHWWFSARADILITIIKQFKPGITKLLDIGCGTGYFLTKAADIADDLYGIDPATYECTRFDDIIKGTVENVPFADNTFECVICLDVLEHIENPKQGLAEICRVLKPGGIAVITVPACQVLFGPHDIANDHFRRFSRKDFEALIGNEFVIEKSTYFNSLLFPIEACIRLAERIVHRCITKGEAQSKFINNCLFRIFDSEKNWLAKHNYNIGVSYLAVIRKK